MGLALPPSSFPLFLPLCSSLPSSTLSSSLLFFPLSFSILPHLFASLPPTPLTPCKRKNSKPGREALPGTELVGTLILDFQDPELWANECLLFQPPSVWYFVLAAWVYEYILQQTVSWEHVFLECTREVSFCRRGTERSRECETYLERQASGRQQRVLVSRGDGEVVRKEGIDANFTFFTILLVDYLGRKDDQSHGNCSINL